MNHVEITLEGVSVRRGARALFAPVTARIGPGEFVAVRGANGAGKTSLLRALAGLLRVESGAAYITRGDRRLDLDDARLCCLLLGHDDGLKPQRTPRQEARYWALALGGGLERVEPALITLALTAQAEIPCRHLSAGQRRRAALMRLALTERPIWLLDEPAANLDEAGRACLEQLIEDHRSRGGIVLAALHEAWAARDGHVIALGPV